MRALMGLMSRCLVAAPALPAAAQSPVERGRYLVEVLGACGNCHTPKGLEGDAQGVAESDLRALLAYLRSLPPIRNRVPAPEPPKKP